MIDFIAKLISGDGLTTVLVMAAIYILILWLMFSFWVFVDARKRYKKTSIGIIFFFVVFIFNFPALIFYIVTRPEDENDFLFFHPDNLSNKGVNIPIVNFVGKDGKVNFSFELKINNTDVANPADMSVDVNWKSENKDFIKQEELKESNSVVKKKEVDLKMEKKDKKSEDKDKKESKNLIDPKYKQKALNSLNSVKTRVTGFKPKFNLPKKK